MPPIDSTVVVDTTRVTPNWTWLGPPLGVALGLWGSLPVAIQLLLILMTFDILAGTLRSLKEWKLDESINRKGILKKLGVVLAVAIVWFLDRHEVVPVEIGQFAAGWYALYEALSALRNLRAIGVPMPSVLVRTLENWQRQKEEELK